MNRALTYLQNSESSPMLSVNDRLYGDEPFMQKYLELRKQVELKRLEIELKSLDRELKLIDA